MSERAQDSGSVSRADSGAQEAISSPSVKGVEGFDRAVEANNEGVLNGLMPLLHKTERELFGCVGCVGCGHSTEFACPFCIAYERTIIRVCGKPECREKHEGADGAGCIRTRKAVTRPDAHLGAVED